ncbi:FUSC family protein [Roseomonas sp. NAR14]|uniref:FUSC family protein n=1 Tax=Roseomonas acroporae TaxID=2937791 RepID=A0A9X1Y6J4_9PROT|nr:FUSC family protein [Roseomonas acroporae]MCK8783125.1 FUSC family protein [Roseomonas acroporae]
MSNPFAAIGRKEWLFSLRTFAAGLLALYIAFSLNLPRPYWAFGTVYIVTQLSSGALRAKAMWRFTGTLVGGAFAIAAVTALVDAPPLLVLAIALWVPACLTLSLLDPTPRSYAFMLAGYTAAFIAFPGVDSPGTIFDTALARVIEIGLGIACAYLVHGVLFPRPSIPAMLAQMRTWLGQLARFGAEALRGPIAYERFAAERRRIARDGAALDVMFHQARYEHGAMRAALRWLPLLRGDARQVPTLISAIADRVGALREADPAAHAALAPLLREVGDWMLAVSRPGVADPGRAEAAAESGAALRARLRVEEERGAATGGWAGLLREGLSARVIELVDTWLRCLGHAHPISAAAMRGERPPEAPLSALGTGLRPPGHTDALLVGLSGLASFLAIVGISAFWILAAWPAGGGAAMIAAVGTCFFAQLDDPAPAISKFLTGTTIAVAIAWIYMFAVLPSVDGFALLALALGLVYLPLGAMQAVPSLMGVAMPIAVTAPTVMSLQETYAADAAGLLDGGIATIIGLAGALLATRLVRSIGIRWRIRRLAAADRRDLARLARRRRLVDLRPLADAMFDRFEAIASRLGPVDPASVGLVELGPLRAAYNVLRLRAALERLGPPLAARLEDAIDAIAEHARGRADDAATLARLDEALREALAADAAGTGPAAGAPSGATGGAAGGAPAAVAAAIGPSSPAAAGGPASSAAGGPASSAAGGPASPAAGGTASPATGGPVSLAAAGGRPARAAALALSGTRMALFPAAPPPEGLITGPGWRAAA